MATTPSIPSLSITIFAQSWAPVGWTRVTSEYDDYALRITSTTSLTPNPSGLGFSSVFSYQVIRSYVTLNSVTVNPDPGSLTNHNHTLGPNGPRYGSFTSSKGYYSTSVARMKSSSVRVAPTTSAGGGGSHTHTVDGLPETSGSITTEKDFTIKYIDVILARRN